MPASRPTRLKTRRRTGWQRHLAALREVPAEWPLAFDFGAGPPDEEAPDDGAPDARWPHWWYDPDGHRTCLVSRRRARRMRRQRAWQHYLALADGTAVPLGEVLARLEALGAALDGLRAEVRTWRGALALHSPSSGRAALQYLGEAALKVDGVAYHLGLKWDGTGGRGAREQVRWSVLHRTAEGRLTTRKPQKFRNLAQIEASSVAWRARAAADRAAWQAAVRQGEASAVLPLGGVWEPDGGLPKGLCPDDGSQEAGGRRGWPRRRGARRWRRFRRTPRPPKTTSGASRATTLGGGAGAGAEVT